MNKIESRFNLLKQNGQKALIPYITAGDPDLETTRQLVLEMDKNGADLIEIGIPYSDPVADGPVIQRAAQRALEKGIKIKEIMGMVGEIRKETQVPLLYLLYYNCIFQYGIERFLSDCQKVGIDGLIIPDLPYEENQDLKEMALNYNVEVISLIAPTSAERIQKIARDARGFIYCVSSRGVTGMRSTITTNLSEFMGEIGRYSHVPRAIGFGISSPQQVREIKYLSDGVIVGSAIVKIIEDSLKANDSHTETVSKVGSFVSDLKAAL